MVLLGAVLSGSVATAVYTVAPAPTFSIRVPVAPEVMLGASLTLLIPKLTACVLALLAASVATTLKL